MIARLSKQGLQSVKLKMAKYYPAEVELETYLSSFDQKRA